MRDTVGIFYFLFSRWKEREGKRKDGGERNETGRGEGKEGKDNGSHGRETNDQMTKDGCTFELG